MDAIARIFVDIVGSDPVLQGVAGGLVITALNTIGALTVLVWQRPSQRSLDAGLGFATGVMLTASFTSLILPGIKVGGLMPVLIGAALGALVLDLADHLIPHQHLDGELRREGPPPG